MIIALNDSSCICIKEKDRRKNKQLNVKMTNRMIENKMCRSTWNKVRGLGWISALLWGTFIQGGHSAAPSAELAQAQNLKIYLEQIVHPNVYRNYRNVDELNRVSTWLREQMRLFGIPCQFQTYQTYGQNYRNVVCQLDVGHAKKAIIGAHYDVYEDLPGADDNASGVAGVLETARILAKQRQNLKQNVEFVFYTLEEPPFFRSKDMGSYRHAKSVLAQKEQIEAIYILEMIGFYREQDGQDYPTGLKWLYPKDGNFIAAVSNFQSRHMAAQYCTAMQHRKKLDCQRLVAPEFITGVDFSDHLNYWQMDMPAIMITDTAFFRNKHYHTAQDTIEKLNLGKMAEVVNGLVKILQEQNNRKNGKKMQS